jgi:hypothetical protein
VPKPNGLPQHWCVRIDGIRWHLDVANVLQALAVNIPYVITRDTTIDNYNYTDGYCGPRAVTNEDMDQLATAITNLQQPYNLFG